MRGNRVGVQWASTVMARVIPLPAFNATKFDEFAKSRIFDGFVNSSQGLRAAKASCGERIAYRLDPYGEHPCSIPMNEAYLACAAVTRDAAQRSYRTFYEAVKVHRL